MSLFLVFLLLYTGFVLWLASRILAKADIAKGWVFCLLIPIINILMLWVFAFSHWPGVHPSKTQKTLTHDK